MDKYLIYCILSTEHVCQNCFEKSIEVYLPRRYVDGARSPYEFSKRHKKIVEQNKYESLEWLDPWKAYKQGLIPLGLAEAYEKKWGYNPLKTARHYFWLDQLRSLAWQCLLMSIIYGIGAVIITDTKKDYTTPLAWKYLKIAGIGWLIASIILATTWKASWRMKKRVWETKPRLKWFMMRFQDVFETQPPSTFTTAALLLLAVTGKMTSTANSILAEEAASGNAQVPRSSLEHLSEDANGVGLGKEWDIYFVEAAKSLDTYACFTWQI